MYPLIKQCERLHCSVCVYVCGELTCTPLSILPFTLIYFCPCLRPRVSFVPQPPNCMNSFRKAPEVLIHSHTDPHTSICSSPFSPAYVAQPINHSLRNGWSWIGYFVSLSKVQRLDPTCLRGKLLRWESGRDWLTGFFGLAPRRLEGVALL